MKGRLNLLKLIHGSGSPKYIYISEKVLTPKFFNDAVHIAAATTYKVDVIVSWNFKHIVNLNRIRLFNSVNLKQGFSIIEIRSPREVLTLSA